MSYYHGLISSKRANSILNDRGNGTFLIRDSQSQPGCFVLSAKSSGKVYHVLIFHKGGQYSLDIADGESDTPTLFSSLDDLVVFCMSHQMKMEGDEVSLKEVIHCEDELSTSDDFAATLESNGSHGTEDTDLLTDLFISLFGRQCSVVSVAHSSLNFAGQPLEGGEERLVLLIRDRPQKAFFIKVVETKERKVIGEKRVNKNFQYDTPGDLVITYLSAHGITCVGFRDAVEKERFCHQLDRVARWLGERADKQKERVRERGDRQKKGREETDSGIQHDSRFVSKIKAEDFNIDNVSPEWQYLFDMAGVTRGMMEDRGTLQFILDTVQKLGGAPHDLDLVVEEAVHSETADPSKPGAGSDSVKGKGGVEMKRERMKVLAVDHALRRETHRASQLAEELQRHFIKRDSPLPLLSPGCVYKSHCESFKDYLTVRHTLVAIGPEKGSCYCQQCVAGKPIVQVAGSPPQQYSLPLGWCRFIHRSQSHVLAQQFLSRWHMAYCSVATTRVAGVMRTGQLPTTQSTGEVKLSPDIQTACIVNPATPMSYEDDLSGQHFKVKTAFQVYVQPGSYSVDAVTEQSNSPSQSQLAWTAYERTYIVHALLVQMIPVTPHIN